MDGWTLYNMKDGGRERVLQFFGPYELVEELVREIMAWPLEGPDHYILVEIEVGELMALDVIYPNASRELVTVLPRPEEVPV